jgi:hypothetical protein
MLKKFSFYLVIPSMNAWLTHPDIKIFETKYRHILPVFILIIVSILTMIASANFTGTFKWDGLVYSLLAKKYLATSDLSLFNIQDIPWWTPDVPTQSYFNRITYYWSAKLLASVFHLSDKSLFLILDFFPLTCAAIFFYATCYRYLSLSITTSLFAAMWLLILPPAKISYEVLAHPEALCLMFMSLTMYASLAQKHFLAAILLAFSIMTRESAAILGVFLGAYHYLHAEKQTLRLFIHLSLYVLGIVVGLGIPAHILKNTTFSNFYFLNLVMAENRDFGFAFLLNNFSLIWVPYFFGLVKLDTRTKFLHVIVIFLACVLLIAARDWWRVLYGNMYFIVLPVAANAMTHFFKKNALYVFSFCSFVLFSFPPYTDFEKLQHPNFWPYYAMLSLFFIQGLTVKEDTE